jgi:hypothetical protein
VAIVTPTKRHERWHQWTWQQSPRRLRGESCDSRGTSVAGVQIALTEPIRIDDVVIVEGDWGRIEEVNTMVQNGLAEASSLALGRGFMALVL